MVWVEWVEWEAWVDSKLISNNNSPLRRLKIILKIYFFCLVSHPAFGHILILRQRINRTVEIKLKTILVLRILKHTKKHLISFRRYYSFNCKW